MVHGHLQIAMLDMDWERVVYGSVIEQEWEGLQACLLPPGLI